jgi:hypothetical protein
MEMIGYGYLLLEAVDCCGTRPKVLHFNRCLTTAHFNGNFDTDNHIYVP